MIRKKSDDNTVAIDDVTGISVRVSIEGGDLCGDYTLEKIPLQLIEKQRAIDINYSTGKGVIWMHTLKRYSIHTMHS